LLITFLNSLILWDKYGHDQLAFVLVD